MPDEERGSGLGDRSHGGELPKLSFAHAAVMSFQAFRNLIAHGELIGSAVLVIISVTLLALAPAKWKQESPLMVNDQRVVGSGSRRVV